LHVPGKPANLHTSILGDGIISEHGLTARIIHTPGHTPGGCCLLFEQEKLLISGDTLFAGSVGRTDLPGGDWPELFASLQKLCQLPDDLTVIPGHGPTTSLGAEKKYNLYLNGEQP
jgi:glyoxylase-like metal-dependent hydrolase (beta-lactamase superfamily II)